MLAWHRARSGFGQERTALLNRTRGLLAEFGVWLGRSSSVLIRQLPILALDEPLPDRFRPLLANALEHRAASSSASPTCDTESTRTLGTANKPSASRLSPASGNSRQRSAGHSGQSARLQERAADGRLDWPGAATKQLRWKTAARRHHGTRRYLPTQPANRRARSTLQVALKREPSGAPDSSTGSSLYTAASAITKRWWPSLISMYESSGLSWSTGSPTIPMPGAGTLRSAIPWPPKAYFLSTTKTRSKIKNEVRPSTVKTWLTIWRRLPTQPIDHRPRAHAVKRLRTPYATIILARKSLALHPTRPRREMQSHPQLRSICSRQHQSRAPPQNIRLKTGPLLLTGTSVEVVRQHRHLSHVRSRHGGLDGCPRVIQAEQLPSGSRK